MLNQHAHYLFMIWNCFCTESVKGIIDPKSYLRNYLLVSNYIKGYSCMCGVINFRMRNFGQKLKILNVKTETELELASSGIATILGSVLFWAACLITTSTWGALCDCFCWPSVCFERGPDCQQCTSTSDTATAAGSRQQGGGRRHEAPLHCLVNVVACRLFNCGPLVTHSHSLTTSSWGEFYLNKL